MSERLEGASPPAEPAAGPAPERGDAPRPRGAAGPRVGMVILLIAIALLVWHLSAVVLVVFGGILFAVALDGFAYLLGRATRLPRGWALLVVVVTWLGIAVGGSVMLGDALISEIRAVSRELPAIFDRVSRVLSDDLGIDSSWSSVTSTLSSQAVPASRGVVTVLASAVIVIASGLFLAINPSLYQRGVLHLVPPRHRGRIAELLHELGHVLRWWLVGQACSMAILGTVISATLYAVGVPLWLGLGIITATLTFIPYFGPLIAGVPILVLSFAEGVETGLTVLVLYVIVQNLEGFFITPTIQQRAIRMPPALLISSQVAMGVLFGVPGFILAAPVTAVAMVTVKVLYVRPLGPEQVRAGGEPQRASSA
jgi:predicted PurR-regulated permease PerM